MRKTWAVAQKELVSYFSSPVAYVIMAVFFLIVSYFFVVTLLGSQVAEPEFLFGNMSTIVLFMAPFLTMRLFSEEFRRGTDELLMTSPLSSVQLVLGKYLAVEILWVIMLVISGIYPIIMSVVGNPERGQVIGGFVGMFLLGSALLAIGLFASALSNHQMIAGGVAFMFMLLLWLIDTATGSFLGEARDILQRLSIFEHFNDFLKGVLDLAHVFYFVSLTLVFLILTYVMVERKRWQ